MRINVMPARFAGFCFKHGYSARPDESLEAVISNHWDWVLGNTRSTGANTVICRAKSWTDLSAEVLERRNEDTKAFIDDLDRIDPASLSETAQLNQRMLKTSLQRR